jgi:hypothetical protein
MSNSEDELAIRAADKTKTTTVSERKAHANRENSKLSTGPRTARGKRNSSFNAVKHGLLSKRLMFDSDGKPENGLHELLEGLRGEYGHGDVRVELLLEAVMADYWRQSRGLQHEMHVLGKGADAFHPQGMMSNIFRYMAGSRRALLKSLELLEKLRAPTREGADTDDSNGGTPSEEMQALDEHGQEPEPAQPDVSR